MKTKRFLSLITAIITLAVSLNPVFAAQSEVEVKDGTIEACSPGEILLNEDFSGDAVPSGKTANGNATWKTSNLYLEDGSLYIPTSKDDAKTYAQVTLATPATGVGNKYVLSFDISKESFRNANVVYGFSMNGAKWLTFAPNAADETYSIRIGGGTDGNTTVASGIAVGQVVNIKSIITIKEAGLVADFTVTNSNGRVLGKKLNFSIGGYDATKKGFDTILFGYADAMKLDNIVVYPYKSAAPADPTITEIPVSGTPEMAEGKTNIIEENFDTFPSVIENSTYKGADNSEWELWGFDIYGETKVLSSGRKAFKLSDNAGTLAAVVPTQKLLYSEEENASNKYVQLFGMRYNPADTYEDSAILTIKNKDGKSINVLSVINKGIEEEPEWVLKTANDEGIAVEDKWYSVAVVYELKADMTVIKTSLNDGSETIKLSKVIIPDTNSIDQFIWSVPTYGVMYLDNVSVYEAEYIEAQKPEARDMTVLGACYNGRELEGSYEYFDANLEDRGEDEYYWARGKNSDGSDSVKIQGTEQSFNYTLSKDDIGNYVLFVVIPKKAEDCDERIGDITYKAADAVITEEPAVADLEWLINKNLGTSDLSDVTEDLILSLKGENGSTIVWQSDDEDTIGTDGTVRRQSSLRNVTLTATITSPDKLVTKEHKFEVSVKAKKTSQGGSGGSGGGGGGASNVIKGSSSVISMPVEMMAEDTNKPMERPKHKYNDVADTHWAMDYIQELYHREIATGDENNNFAPDRTIKREEFTKMIVSAFNLIDDTAFVEFEDVDSSAWYYSYVASAYKSLLVSGVGNDKFGIGENITRQDMAVIAYRILKAKGIAINGEIAEEFADFAEVSDYARTAVSAMQKAGVMSGSGNNEFRPRAYATRAEVARIIVALLECAGK